MKNALLIILLSLLVLACSASKEQSESDSDVYVFDDAASIEEPVKEEPVVSEENPEDLIRYDYIVQVGAFTTKVRAEKFVNDNKEKIKYPMMIIYDNNLNYHLVQLPVFQDRDPADRAVRELLQVEEFKDAFVKPIPEVN